MKSTWQWGQEENHPYHTLTSMKVGGRNIYIHHWISQGNSTVQIARAGLRILAVNGQQLFIAIWSISVRSINKVQWSRLKRKARLAGKESPRGKKRKKWLTEWTTIPKFKYLGGFISFICKQPHVLFGSESMCFLF